MRFNEFSCDNCDFRMPPGLGKYRYVETESGERQRLRHPGEHLQILKVLGEDASEELIEERTGYITHFACRTCANAFELDEENEEICPECGSIEVVSEVDLVGDSCPNCVKGTFEAETTGIV